LCKSGNCDLAITEDVSIIDIYILKEWFNLLLMPMDIVQVADGRKLLVIYNVRLNLNKGVKIERVKRL
jgi:hypothetical protein